MSFTQFVISLINASNVETVDVCATYLTKDYDFNSLYMKLVKKDIPLQLLELLENWLSDSFACVKCSWSHITGCAVAQHYYNGDVSFLWEKWKFDSL